MKKPFLFVAIALFAGAALVWSHGRTTVGSYARSNILIISVDALRADHLGTYGYGRDCSPTIDALSKRAVTFDRAFAPRGSTWPSLTTMLTSLSPVTHNVRENGQYPPPDIRTIAHILGDAGYSAEAFVSGTICYIARRVDAFKKVACGEDTYVASAAADFIRSNDGRPFFAWLHILAPHGPYDPPAAYDRFTRADYHGQIGRDQLTLGAVIRNQKPLTDEDRAQLYGLYDGEILFADAQIALVLKALEEKGLQERTIVVFLADHGEELADHNGYLYHSCSVYDSVLRIPLIIALPDGAGAGRRSASIIETQDLAPTLLELVGLEPLPSFEGRSRITRLGSSDESPPEASTTNGEFSSSEWYASDVDKTIQTVRTARWRYVSNPSGLTPRCPPRGDYYKVQREELYDHASDPLDHRNVVADHPELAQRFAKIAEAENARSIKVKPQEIDKNLEGELRSFGYVE
ncbi:MAG TPA: sulfatase [Candidatus Limnocylindrales bacterium]|nr:sulfatase [Candidatus Limnocylindrales bacterium]